MTPSSTVSASSRVRQALAQAMQTAQRSTAYFAEYRKQYPVVEPDTQGRVARHYPDGRVVVLHPAPRP